MLTRPLNSSLRFILFAGICAALVACLFTPGLNGSFIFDDTPNIVTNTVLHVNSLNLDDWLYAAYSFQPGHGSRALSMLSFTLDYWRGDGLNPRAFKTTNLLIHVTTFVALAIMLRRMFTMAQWPPSRAAAGAILLSLAWASHPIQVSSVLYVVQRMQTLCTLFLVLALWAYLAMRQAQMEGKRSIRYGILMLLFWILGFAAKEDAVLLPLYTLALELTLLRFQAAQPTIEKSLRRGYLWLTAAGAVIYLAVIVPHFWTSDAYPGRDFSSAERLLTQGRVLSMYISQIILPTPSRLPFYYDNIVISRSMFHPATTFTSILLILGLLALAWRWRKSHPLFAFGVLMFFGGHFMTSNVIGLELAFEHRNHLPLIGALIAIADIGLMVANRWCVPRRIGLLSIMLLLLGLAVGTFIRAKDWGDPLKLAEDTVRFAPLSERAWLDLATIYAIRGMSNPGGPDMAHAIDLSQKGASITGSLPLLSNLVINKTLRGDVTRADWDKYLDRLGQVPISAQNRNTIWALLANIERGVPLDKEATMEAIDIVSSRWSFSSYENLRFGAFIHNETRHPERALPYLRRAVKLARPDDPDVNNMLVELKGAGRADWALELEKQAKASRKN